MAACLQIWVWNLTPQTAPWLWILGATTYVLGGLIILLFLIPNNTNPLHRAMAAQRFMISSLVCIVMLGASFSSPAFHTRLKQLPVDVARFVFGKVGNG
jgi:hypothetical protein